MLNLPIILSSADDSSLPAEFLNTILYIPLCSILVFVIINVARLPSKLIIVSDVSVICLEFLCNYNTFNKVSLIEIIYFFINTINFVEKQL